MLAQTFRELDVYRHALHGWYHTLPCEERYALAGQMRRASRSVCSNVAEAWRKRRYRAAFVAKLSDAEAEAGEMQAWLDVANRLGYLDAAKHHALDSKYEIIIGQLVTMINGAERWCTL